MLSRTWKSLNDAWKDGDRVVKVRRWLKIFALPDWLRQLRYAMWPLLIGAGLGLVSLWAYDKIQAFPDFISLWLIGRVSASAVAVAIGIGFITFVVLLPFWIPKTDALDLPKRFELAALLGGGVVALAGAIFLIGEYQDQKQARVTRAWDLLHKATNLARDRASAAKALKTREIESDITALRKKAGECLRKKDCKEIETEIAALTADRDKLIRSHRQMAALGNDGQLGALRTLNEAKVSLENVKLAEMDLSGAILPAAELFKADLSRTQLPGSNLIEANLSNADLSFTDLSFASLGYAYLNNANLEDSVLRLTSFVAADLGGADLSNADLDNTDFRWASLNRADLDGAKLLHANFSHADLTHARNVPDLSKARLCETILPDGKISNRNCNMGPAGDRPSPSQLRSWFSGVRF